MTMKRVRPSLHRPNQTVSGQHVRLYWGQSGIHHIAEGQDADPVITGRAVLPPAFMWKCQTIAFV